MNAIDFLINEHEHVRKTLADIKNDSHRPETKRKMFDQLAYELVRHEKMEHQVWYPHFKNNNAIDDTVKHLVKEENHAEKVIKKLQKINDDSEWEIEFGEFKKEVEHHADEEETKLFPKVKTILSETELNNIGKEMLQFKKSYT